MIDLSKVKLPSAVVVGGDLFKIKTDFRFWLLFSKLNSNGNTKLIEFDFMYEGKAPENRLDGYIQLLDFYNPPHELPRPTGKTNNTKIIDYVIDSELIYSAFYERYKIDLFDEDLRLHWHKFLALLSGLKDTRLNDIMSYRAYEGKDKDLLKLKRAWELPQNRELSEETKEFNKLFEKK